MATTDQIGPMVFPSGVEKAIRDRIWATYVPGQEITKTPSEDYLEAAMEATRFALKADKEEARKL